MDPRPVIRALASPACALHHRVRDSGSIILRTPMTIKTLLAFALLSPVALQPALAQAPASPTPDNRTVHWRSLPDEPEAASPASPAPSAPAVEQITINVLGQVNYPARVNLPKGSGLLDAIAAAGGFSRIANPARILLIHKTPADKPDTEKLDMRTILNGTTRDIPLRNGDTVVVGQAMF